MTTMHVTKLECVRKQDVTGSDEIVIFLDAQDMGVWPMNKGQIRTFSPHSYQALHRVLDGGG